jgi:hypothetical protein
MEIRGLGINATPATAGTARLRETTAPPAPAQAPKGAALSPTGQLFLQARRALAEQPEVRTSLVQGLARQVQTGRYTINAGQVAAALVPEG